MKTPLTPPTPQEDRPDPAVSIRTQRAIEYALQRLEGLDEQQMAVARTLQETIADRLRNGESVELRAGGAAGRLLGNRVKAFPLRDKPGHSLVYAVEDPAKPGEWIEDTVYGKLARNPKLASELAKALDAKPADTLEGYRLPESPEEETAMGQQP